MTAPATPTPSSGKWHYQRLRDSEAPLLHAVVEAPYGGRVLCRCRTEEEARLIVRAVNSHQPLYDALRELVDAAPFGVRGERYHDACIRARAALRAAEEPV